MGVHLAPESPKRAAEAGFGRAARGCAVPRRTGPVLTPRVMLALARGEC